MKSGLHKQGARTGILKPSLRTNQESSKTLILITH